MFLISEQSRPQPGYIQPAGTLSIAASISHYWSTSVKRNSSVYIMGQGCREAEHRHLACACHVWEPPWNIYFCGGVELRPFDMEMKRKAEKEKRGWRLSWPLQTLIGSAKGIRTPVSGVRGQRPRPLDDGATFSLCDALAAARLLINWLGR